MDKRYDPIVDDSPHKRRKFNTGEGSAKQWDSQDDSGDDLFTEEDYQTAATLPVTDSQKRKLQYPPSQFHADLGIGSDGRSSQPPYNTQPTQTLPVATQPTQVLEAPKRPEIQVELSSPIAPNTSSPRPTPQPISRAPFAKPYGLLASAMAPPGTSFRKPLGVQSRPPPVDVDSDDDPPVQHSDNEETQGFSSNIKPTNFKRAGRGLDSSPNKVVKESPDASAARSSINAFDNLISGFTYRPTSSRTADDMSGAYGSVSRPPRPQQSSRQSGPAKALPTQPRPIYRSVDDIPDYSLRRKCQSICSIMGPDFSVDRCVAALSRKHGNENDAMEWLSEQQDAEKEADELALSPIQKRGVASSTSQAYTSSQPNRPAAKQQVKAPAKTIAEKYKRGSLSKAAPKNDSDDEDDVMPRGKLVRGRPTLPSSPPSSPLPQKAVPHRLSKKAAIVIDSDSEGDSGIVRDESEEVEEVKRPRPSKPEEIQLGMQELRDQRLLNLMNDCTAHDLAELSGQPEDTIQFVLDRRPFVSLNAVREITMETLTKTGKKSKKTKAVGDKLVEDCTEVMTGYDAIDELVVQCERIAQPVQEALRGWGVGDTADGELQLMTLDEAHDSGIGTPASSCAPEDPPAQTAAKTKVKGGFISQPENMDVGLPMKNYQLVGLNWLYLLFQKELSCILADDMGLGKTCQVIAFLSYLKLKKVDGVHLIIVPGSTLENWLREFQRFSPHLEVRPYYGLQNERAELRYIIEEEFSEIDVIVTTYDMAVAKEDNRFLRNLGPFSVCVYDEAHALRNPNSLRYRNLVRIRADFKVLLTGTPLQNNLQELIAILAFIMPKLFEEKREDLEYIFKHKASTKDTASAALLSNERIARARTMMTPFILRRKKAQVLDLPAKTSRVEYCDMTDSQAAYYHGLLEDAQQFYKDKAAKTVKGTAKQSSNVIMSLRQAAIHPLLAHRIYDDKKIDKIVTALQKSEEFGGNPPDMIRAYLNGEAAISLHGGDYGLHKFCNDRPSLQKRFALKRKEWMDSGKVKKFEELVTKFAENGDRVLVFSQFTTVMNILEAVLEEMSIKFMRLDGSTKMELRQDIIDQFYSDTSIPVFMLSTRAGGAGINLAAANKVIIFDSGFNPQDDIQAENRAHRVGQTREVEVVRLVTKGTIEEQIRALGESKLALDERVAGEGATTAEASAAEKAGEQRVEQMFVETITKEEAKPKEEPLGGDIRDAFKTSLEGKGLKVASKQAQY